jgi:hypothetical protein
VEALSWVKLIWNSVIPPSKSLLVWRLMNNKIPADKNLMTRGCNVASICNLCNNLSESSNHILLDCPLQYHCRIGYLIFKCAINHSSTSCIWNISERSWSPQAKLIVLDLDRTNIELIGARQDKYFFSN